MGKLIKTQDIDEFSEIIIIPDKAITETIILNVKKLDEEKDFAKVTGAITANPALKERYFSNFITQVENSGLFKKIDVINKKTTSGMDIDNMTFELKCEI